MNRQDKVSQLIPTVRSEGDGFYTVASLSCEGWRYLVSPRTATAPARCECEDYRRHAPRASDSGWRCIHILAVRAVYRATHPKPPTIREDQIRLSAHVQRGQAQRPQHMTLH